MEMQKQYRDVTCYLKPIHPIVFTDSEMLQALLHFLNPLDIASCTQLSGDKKGIIRITFKSHAGVKKLEEVVAIRQLKIQAVTLGLVDEKGLFFVVTLENVPQYLTDDDVEKFMSKFGHVAGSSRDFIEIRGNCIENEKRHIYFTTLYERKPVPKEMVIFGHEVFAYTSNCGVCGEHSGRSKESAFSGINACKVESVPEQGHLHVDFHSDVRGSTISLNKSSSSVNASQAGSSVSVFKAESMQRRRNSSFKGKGMPIDGEASVITQSSAQEGSIGASRTFDTDQIRTNAMLQLQRQIDN